MPTLTLPIENRFDQPGWEKIQAGFLYKYGENNEENDHENNHIHVVGSIWAGTIEVTAVSIKYLGRNRSLPLPNVLNGPFGNLPWGHPPDPLRRFYIEALQDAGLIP